MLLVAKSAFKADQIQTKLNLGADAIELQLLAEMVDGELGRYKKAEAVYDFSILEGVLVVAVHAPLLGKYGLEDINIETLVDDRDFSLMEQVFYIANKIGQRRGKRIIVVFHSEMSAGVLEDLGSTWVSVVSCIRHLLYKYPYTELAIENVSPLSGVYKGEIRLRNNFKFDNVKLANRLREEIGTDRVGTVLDTCHAMLAEKYLTAIYSAVGDCTEIEDYSLEAYMNANKDTIKLFHLCDMVGSGYGKGKHGTPLRDQSGIILTRRFIDKYSSLGLTCPVTLEVEETDFSICDGFRDSKNLVETLLKC